MRRGKVAIKKPIPVKWSTEVSFEIDDIGTQIALRFDLTDEQVEVIKKAGEQNRKISVNFEFDYIP